MLLVCQKSTFFRSSRNPHDRKMWLNVVLAASTSSQKSLLNMRSDTPEHTLPDSALASSLCAFPAHQKFEKIQTLRKLCGAVASPNTTAWLPLVLQPICRVAPIFSPRLVWGFLPLTTQAKPARPMCLNTMNVSEEPLDSEE